MFLAIRERLERGREEGGFTLIELMVVVLIIAILIAIAIPTFLGARKRAQDKQAQSNIRNGLTAEKTFYVDNQAYTETASPDLSDIEASLDFTTNDASVRGVEPVLAGAQAANDDQAVCLQSKSKSGTMFALVDVASGANAGAWYNSDTAGADVCAASGTLFDKTGWSQDLAVGW
jgi:type IV pilus assembly protein PilA